jgi:hypothetical protein
MFSYFLGQERLFSETGYFFAEANSKDFSNLLIGAKIIKIISYIENIQHKHRYI